MRWWFVALTSASVVAFLSEHWPLAAVLSAMAVSVLVIVKVVDWHLRGELDEGSAAFYNDERNYGRCYLCWRSERIGRPAPTHSCRERGRWLR